MPTIRAEYTTVTALRTSYLTMSATSGTADDGLLLDLIRSTSRDIEDIGNGRIYYPRIETRVYDAPKLGAGFNWINPAWVFPNRLPNLGQEIVFDCTVGEVTQLTNGDGTVIPTTAYVLYPANEYPKNRLKLLRTAGYYFQPTTAGDYEQAVTVQMVQSGHPEYGSAWETLTTLAGAITTSATTAALTDTGGEGGQLWKIGNEYLYAGSVATTSATGLVRGVNGSTAAAATTGSTVSVWRVPANIELICRQAAAAAYNFRKNPTGASVSLDGVTFQRPDDIRKFIERALDTDGFTREAIG